MTNRRARIVALATLTLVLVAAWLLLYRECAIGGAMAGAYRTCTCAGVERLIFDGIESDGPRRTVCLGWVTSRACFQYRDGPQIDCARAFG